MQTAIPCLLMRGGTSKGPYFLKEDLPSDETLRNKTLLAIMGSPDERQINGIGGGTTLTSKVAILSPSPHPWAKVDFLFAQVSVNTSKVDLSPTCGNMLAGVGPAAIEKNLVTAVDGKTIVKIRAVNTGALIEAVVCTPGGKVTYEGNTSIDGVPGTGSPILLNFMEIVGSKTGKMLPTGTPLEEINGVKVTCIDVAMPMVIAQAQSLGKTGYETKAQLDADQDFLQRIEAIRRIAGARMGLGDVKNSVIPKFAIIAPPRQEGTITSRYFVPDNCHAAHAVTGAICVSSCALVQGSVADGIAQVTDAEQQNIMVEHPSGKIEISLVTHKYNSELIIERAGVIRTARLLFSGQVYC